MVTREQAFELTDRALALAAICGSFLSSEEPEVQGCALADMVATFLRGHRIFGDDRSEREMREEVFAQWIKTVRDLLLLYDKPPVGTQ
jgi:hypothetical protein